MTPLVLIPGMMCDERMWGATPAALGATSVIHALPVEGETIAAMAAAILHKMPERFALAGLSMGGIVAMEMLAQSPGRIERLALLDTNPRAEIEAVRLRRGPQIDRVLEGGLEDVMRREMIPHYFMSADQMSEQIELCVDMAQSLGPEIFRRQSLALRDRPDRQEVLSRFKGPALVLTGEDDRLCPRDRHDLMHGLMPQSRLVTIEGAGHIPPLERPDETANAFRTWLEDT